MFSLIYVCDHFLRKDDSASYNISRCISCLQFFSTHLPTYDSTAFGIRHVPMYFANHNRQTVNKIGKRKEKDFTPVRSTVCVQNERLFLQITYTPIHYGYVIVTPVNSNCRITPYLGLFSWFDVLYYTT